MSEMASEAETVDSGSVEPAQDNTCEGNKIKKTQVVAQFELITRILGYLNQAFLFNALLTSKFLN